MRQLATLPRDQARVLADHLLTLQIKTQLNDAPDGTAIWVCDEDQIARAREELKAYQADPNDPRYRSAAGGAQAIRAAEARAEADYQKRQRRFYDRMADLGDATRLGPVTIALIAVSFVVTLTTSFGRQLDSPFLQALFITPVDFRAANDLLQGFDPGDEGDPAARLRRFLERGEFWTLAPITEKGQVWRLVTPIFIHFNGLHLLFNMLMLASLGGAVERRVGTAAYLGLVVLIAAGSNLAEFFVQFGANVPDLIQYQRHPYFGGMSGVVYGLFGYLWMVARASEDPERVLSSQTVVVMLVWLVICTLGAVGAVANTAHVVGLLVGVAVGQLATRPRG